MDDDILSIRTYYEQQWLDRGLNIKYIQFHLPQEGELQEPDVEIELDDYRSYNRSKRSGLKTSKWFKTEKRYDTLSEIDYGRTGYGALSG